MRIKILGKYWTLRWCPNLGPNNGTCDSPKAKNKEIRIQAGLKEQEEITILLHEALHAANFETYSEEYVDALSKDLATMLWRVGYRKEK